MRNTQVMTKSKSLRMGFLSEGMHQNRSQNAQVSKMHHSLLEKESESALLATLHILIHTRGICFGRQQVAFGMVCIKVQTRVQIINLTLWGSLSKRGEKKSKKHTRSLGDICTLPSFWESIVSSFNRWIMAAY